MTLNYGCRWHFYMTYNRRSFIGLGSFVACGAALNVPALFAAAVSRVLPGGLPLLAGDEAVLAFVRGYSTNFRVVGATVLGRIRTSGMRALHVIVEVKNADALQAVLTGAPFADIYADGNTLTFTLADVDVTIENLLPEVFAARLVAMGKRSGNAFAHDALVYNPETHLLSDPFAARSGAVKLVNKTFGGPAALEVALRGMLEAKQLLLPQSLDFSEWKGRVLRMIARAADSRKLSENFLQQIATLAEKLPPGGMEALLRSRLIATALKQVFGMDTAAVIAEFKRLRASTSADTTDAALWLALLIAPEIEANAYDGAATTWLQSGSRFQVLRSRRAMAQARTFLNP